MTRLSITVTALPAGDGVCRVIRLAGEADVTDTALRETLTVEIAARPRLLLIDMTALTFIDSAATQMILSAYHVLHQEGGTLALIRPSPTVGRVLALLGVDQLIRIYSSIPQAITLAG